jgi:hypothetical protein
VNDPRPLLLSKPSQRCLSEATSLNHLALVQVGGRALAPLVMSLAG